MQLTLDHVQRLNLYALMGQQRGSLADTRLFWRLLDRIELTPEEREKIGYTLRDVNGMMQPSWDANKRLDPVAFEFSEEEYKRVERMIDEWQPGFVASFDRLWLEPLLAQIEANRNGHKK